MHRVALLGCLALFGTVLAGCSDSSDQVSANREAEPGDYYSFRCSGGGYKVLKILVVEGTLKHVCFYNNFFKERPTEDVVSSLYFGEKSKLFGGAFHSKEGSVITMGRKHIALNLLNWEHWDTRFLAEGEVTPDELVAYEEWENGGRFIADLKVIPKY